MKLRVEIVRARALKKLFGPNQSMHLTQKSISRKGGTPNDYTPVSQDHGCVKLSC